MKKILVIALLILMNVPFAQDVDSYVELLRSDVKTLKKAIITEVMEFNEADASAFWPVYRNYEYDLEKISDARVAFIKDYAVNYENMTDAKAGELMEQAFNFREKRFNLQKKYYKEFAKILSPAKAAKFVQLENQITLLIDLQVASELPLVKMPKNSGSN